MENFEIIKPDHIEGLASADPINGIKIQRILERFNTKIKEQMIRGSKPFALCSVGGFGANPWFLFELALDKIAEFGWEYKKHYTTFLYSDGKINCAYSVPDCLIYPKSYLPYCVKWFGMSFTEEGRDLRVNIKLKHTEDDADEYGKACQRLDAIYDLDYTSENEYEPWQKAHKELSEHFRRNYWHNTYSANEAIERVTRMVEVPTTKRK